MRKISWYYSPSCQQEKKEDFVQTLQTFKIIKKMVAKSVASSPIQAE